jgi:hypothetical protein
MPAGASWAGAGAVLSCANTAVAPSAKLPVNNNRTDRDKTFSAIISWVSFYLNTWTPFLMEREVLTLFYGNID